MRSQAFLLWAFFVGWACAGGTPGETELSVVFPDLGGQDLKGAADPGSPQDPASGEPADAVPRRDPPQDPEEEMDMTPDEPGAPDEGIGPLDLPSAEDLPTDTGPRCGNGPACGPGFVCLEETCRPYTFDTACGEDCRRCLGTPTPICHQGQCVRCLQDADCGPGFWCNPEVHQCDRCRDDDPQHCGVTCLTCPISHPDCLQGNCR